MKYPFPATAVNPAVLTAEHQLKPNPVAVPAFAIVAPQGMLIVSPLSPKAIVVHVAF